MPNLDSKGDVSCPVRVVAPTRVKRSIGTVMALAPTPMPVTISM